MKRCWLSLSFLLIGHILPSYGLSISPANTFPIFPEEDTRDGDPLEPDNHDKVEDPIEVGVDEEEPRREKSLIGYLGGSTQHRNHHGSHHRQHHGNYNNNRLHNRLQGHHEYHLERNEPAEVDTKALLVQDDLRVNGTVQDDGRICVQKVMMQERTEYQEVMTCTHDYVERCHDTMITTYEPHQEQECDENFRKVCNIIYEDSAINDVVEECRTQFVKTDPCVPGPESCQTVYDTVCDTRQKIHEVLDDVVNCETVYEEKCENVTQGFLVKEECDTWPVQQCSMEKKLVQKYTPETSCQQEPREMCAPTGCQLVEDTFCQNKTKAVIISNPTEECELEPRKVCRQTTKMVPQLRSVKECVDVPKEVCAMSRVNPVRKKYPTIEKWCYFPDSPLQPPSTAPTTDPPQPGVVLLTQVKFYGSQDWSGSATFVGKKTGPHPDGTTCSFNFDYSAPSSVASLESASDLDGCWKAALRGELQAEGGTIVGFGNAPSHLCVDWSSDEEFAYTCDVVEDPTSDGRYNLQCDVSTSANCPDTLEYDY